MKNIPTAIVDLFPIDSADKLKALLDALQSELIASNADLRTLKKSKSLHRVAASMQCTSWSEFLAKLTRHQFEETLQRVYGLSEAYADSAYLTLSDKSRMSGDGATVAHDYCRRFHIAPASASPAQEVAESEVVAPYGQDPKQMRQAQATLEELCEQIAQGDNPDFYGVGAVFEITFVVSSSCNAHLTIDPDSGEIIKGQIREKGFSVGTAEMSVYQRELIAKHFEEEIQIAILALQESR